MIEFIWALFLFCCLCAALAYCACLSSSRAEGCYPMRPQVDPKHGRIYRDECGFEFQVVARRPDEFATVVDEAGYKISFLTAEEWSEWLACVKDVTDDEVGA